MRSLPLHAQIVMSQHSRLQGNLTGLNGRAVFGGLMGAEILVHINRVVTPLQSCGFVRSEAGSWLEGSIGLVYLYETRSLTKTDLTRNGM